MVARCSCSVITRLIFEILGHQPPPGAALQQLPIDPPCKRAAATPCFLPASTRTSRCSVIAMDVADAQKRWFRCAVQQSAAGPLLDDTDPSDKFPPSTFRRFCAERGGYSAIGMDKRNGAVVRHAVLGNWSHSTGATIARRRGFSNGQSVDTARRQQVHTRRRLSGDWGIRLEALSRAIC